MRKGSYSEELASRGRITFQRQHVELRILSLRECEVALFLHNGDAVPVASLRCPRRGFLSCASWKLDPEPLHNNGSLFFESTHGR